MVSTGEAGDIHIGVLGPLRLVVGGVERPLTARRQRAVLACLVLHLGEAVSADRLLHDVWGDEIPASGAKAVAYQVLKLRGLLGPDHSSVLSTTTAGYRLELAPEAIDGCAFDARLDQARALLPADPPAAEALIAQALALTRGRPYADLDEGFLDAEVRRLDGRHVLARRTLAEARLAQGRAADVIDDLAVLLAEQPLEEAIAALLMVALDRAGRTTDALRVFGDLRRRLGSELGIEPSGELRQLEQRLLMGERGGEPARAMSSNLPTPLSSFVGREQEIAEIVGLVSNARLVSLLSFGGVGKTRLAIEVGSRMIDTFANGVRFVDLLRITDPVLLPDALIDGVGIPGTAARDPESHLAAELAGWQALIVVDNCEHLGVEVGLLVGRLLARAPGIRILATSRVSLGVSDEVVWQVPPLPTTTAAIELFTARALLVRPDSVTATDGALIAQICERVDGIPLAIELAAARLRTMTVAEVAEHLEDRFGLLTRADRDVDDRHRSLLATMRWSHDLLAEPDRELLRHVSPCIDGFSLDASVALCAGGRLDVVDRLDRLVAAGLLTFTARSGVGRYRLLETVRDFVASLLDQGERVAAALAHASYYATIAARITELRTDGTDQWIRLGDHEIGNLRAAMAWAFANERPRLAMAMASDLWRYFWEQASGSNENVRWGRLALDVIDEDDDAVMLVAAGTVIEAYNLGDVEAMHVAETRVRRGLASDRAPAVRSRLLTALGSALTATAPRAAEACFDDAWELVPVGPSSINLLGNAVEAWWLTGTPRDEAMVVERMNAVQATMAGGPSPALIKVAAGIAACAGRCHEVLRLTDDLSGPDKALNDTTVLRIEALGSLGRYDEALALSGEPTVNDYWVDVQRVGYFGAAIDLSRGEPAAARDRLDLIARMLADDGRTLAMAMHLAALLAATLHPLGRLDDAARLLGFADSECARLSIGLRRSCQPLVDGAARACRVRLGRTRYDELVAAGAATPWPTLASAVGAGGT